MKAISAAGYFLGLIPGILAITGNLAGGRWTFGATIFVGSLCIADWFVEDSHAPPTEHSPVTPDLVLLLHVLINTLAIGTLYFGVASGRLMGCRIEDAALSTGLNSGVSGLLVAHELIHRREKAWRWAGLWNLLLVNYSHFYVEHVKGHHRLVGTSHDPTTARPGEGIYRYLLRCVPQQWIFALRIEAARLRKVSRWPYGLANYVIVTTLLQSSIALLIYVVFGMPLLSACLRQSAIAVLLLHLVNYLQHYGLSRTMEQKIEPAHSWQSDRISSRFILLELSRHADHHGHASKPYHQLVSERDSPRLPAGLLGTVPLLLIPFLWTWIANRILASHNREAASHDEFPDRSVSFPIPVERRRKAA
jgi:alkane 1-monooxygenase